MLVELDVLFWFVVSVTVTLLPGIAVYVADPTNDVGVLLWLVIVGVSRKPPGHESHRTIAKVMPSICWLNWTFTMSGKAGTTTTIARLARRQQTRMDECWH